MADIIFDGIGKRYPDGFAAIANLDLHIRDGEFLVLVGPSGCGKSTALRMIAGLEDITDGRLIIDGVIANNLAPRDRDIAMVFQSYALYPHLNVEENIGFGLRVRGAEKTALAEKVRKTAELLELSEHLKRKPGQLSGGQRQRVAMGRALVRDPKAFLMDEPLSNLDARLRGQMRTEIARLQKLTGVTTVYVTHDQVEAMTMGDRVAVMRHGVLQQLDTPRALYDTPANLFVAGFIGAPSMNFMAADLAATDGGMDARVGPFDFLFSEDDLAARPGLGRSAGDRVILGIRPEMFTPVEYGESAVNTVTGEIIFVEDLGSTLLAHIDIGAADGSLREIGDDGEDDGAISAPRLRVVLDGQMRVKAGETITLAVDAGHIHVFNAQTESAIRG
ncbi:ATP-binding cassette domain-containing protein [Martelella lutilitoris]|uniref:ATP-binding cassette domain-containing protein n=1 Tax=Martelella lutilitoris TaxID=2583532 RepID=A0A7T7KLZ3_9HYPH|nr:ATP-binding cassette domain-containing protein [Martelella lutilitoris]QQM31262.1 ATP-binding cassette domain-containing protein [Martelella lutilitoris]